MSCQLELAVPRPRLYAGADQPARLSLEIDGIQHEGQAIAVISQDILQMPFCALTRLARSDGAHLPKVLVVAPLSSRFPILLRDLVLGLIPSFQVYVTDWVNARHVPVDRGPFDLDENIFCIIEAMRVWPPNSMSSPSVRPAFRRLWLPPIIRRTTRIAHRAALCSWRRQSILRPIRRVSLGSSGRARCPGTSATSSPRCMLAGCGQRSSCLSGSMQLLGLWAYLARHLREGGELLGKVLTDDGADPVRFPFLDLYSAVMDLPAEVFLETMRHVYQEGTLLRGKFRARNQTVALRSIRATALMTVEGEYDDIAAPGQTQRAHDLCPSVPADGRRQLIVPGCGHFSLFYGGIWRSRVLPEVRAFVGDVASSKRRTILKLRIGS